MYKKHKDNHKLFFTLVWGTTVLISNTQVDAMEQEQAAAAPYVQLMESACGNKLESVSELLRANPTLAQSPVETNQGIDPVKWAAHHGNPVMARLLLDNGFKLRKSRDGSTAFHTAAYEKHDGVLKLLLTAANRETVEAGQTLETLLASKTKIDHIELTPYEAACERYNNPCQALLEPAAIQKLIDKK